jgi:hypothetical protein
MNKSNFTNWLAALCAILLIVVLVLQTKQKSQLETLRQEHKDSVTATEQRQQEARDAFAKLADRVLSLGTNWEAELTPRLNAKSDEIVAAFAARLNEKTTEATTQVANAMRLQAEAALNASAVERSNKTVRLLEAASRYEKAGRPELVELCYLSAMKCSDGNPGVVLKPMLAWKERSVEAMPENDWLTKSPAMLMALYETLDKALPDSSASPEDMENALAVTDGIQGRIIEHQQAKLNEIRGKLSWDTFAAESLTNYEQSKETLTSLSPANTRIENTKSELLDTADNLIQTATAINSFSTTDILPPSPKAPPQVATNWLERGLAFVTNPANPLEARLNAISVLLDFAHNRIEIPACQGYAQTLTNDSIKLACAQWAKHVQGYGEIVDKKEKPDAETMAVGQSLLNQGVAMLITFTNNTSTADIRTTLPGLAAKLYLEREMLFVGQMRLAARPEAFSSKEQAARARSLIYGQILSAMLDAKSLEAEIIKLCNPPSESVATIKGIQKRFGEYLTAYDQLDKADIEDAKAIQLTKLRQQFQRYTDYCREIIKGASDHYDEAERRKSGLRAFSDEPEWVAKWSNTRPQDELKKGLEQLYSIDINDLRQADPGVASFWDSTEEKLKKNLTDSHNAAPQINSQTAKKSKNDF